MEREALLFAIGWGVWLVLNLYTIPWMFKFRKSPYWDKLGQVSSLINVTFWFILGLINVFLYLRAIAVFGDVKASLAFVGWMIAMGMALYSTLKQERLLPPKSKP